MVRGRWIPDEERRRMLASVPDGYRATLAKLTRQAEGDAAGLDAYLGENDPLGLWSSAVQSQLCASGGAGKVAALVRKVREGNPKSQLADEETVNQLGYQLLGGKQSSAAIEIFRLNTELHPRSGNAFDSLAEAYLAAGYKERGRTTPGRSRSSPTTRTRRRRGSCWRRR
jgi:hypothetical protein